MTIRVRAVREEERRTLGQMARSHTLGAGLVRRAQIVLHALDGLKATEISVRMGLCGATVRHWLQRFNARGLPGLDLLRGAEECRDQHGAAPSDGSGPAVRVLDAGSPGRLAE